MATTPRQRSSGDGILSPRKISQGVKSQVVEFSIPETIIPHHIISSTPVEEQAETSTNTMLTKGGRLLRGVQLTYVVTCLPTWMEYKIVVDAPQLTWDHMDQASLLGTDASPHSNARSVPPLPRRSISFCVAYFYNRPLQPNLSSPEAEFARLKSLEELKSAALDINFAATHAARNAQQKQFDLIVTSNHPTLNERDTMIRYGSTMVALLTHLIGKLID